MRAYLIGAGVYALVFTPAAVWHDRLLGVGEWFAVRYYWKIGDTGHGDRG